MPAVACRWGRIRCVRTGELRQRVYRGILDVQEYCAIELSEEIRAAEWERIDPEC